MLIRPYQRHSSTVSTSLMVSQVYLSGINFHNAGLLCATQCHTRHETKEQWMGEIVILPLKIATKKDSYYIDVKE